MTATSRPSAAAAAPDGGTSPGIEQPDPGPHTDQVAGSSPTMARRRYALLAVGLSALVAWVRHWSMAGGWFSADDFVHMTRVTGRPLAEVLPQYNASGHLNNLSGSLDWYLQRVAPYEWGPRVWVVTVSVFVAQCAWMAVAAVMVGRRTTSLVLVTAVGMTTLSLTALQWWAQAAASAPVQVISAACVLGIVLTVSGRSRVWGWLAVGLLALGLLGSERVLLTAGLAFVTPFLYGLRTGIRAGLRTWVAHWPLLLGIVAVTAGYLQYYLSRSPRGGAQPQLDLAELTRGVSDTLLPILVGGPLAISEGAVTAMAATPPWLVWTAPFAVAIAVALAAVRAPRVLIPVALLAGAWLVWSTLLIGLRRVLPDVALDWRIFGDLTSWLMMTALTGAAVLIASPRRRRARGWSTALAWGLAGAILLQMHVITVVNTTRYWWANPAEAFTARALDDLAARPAASLIDEPLPTSVIRGSIITQERLPSVVFGGAPNRPSIDQQTSFPLVLDVSGAPRLAFVEGGTTSTPGPVDGCGWPVEGSVRIPMEASLYPWNWLMRIGYLAGEEATGSISTGGRSEQVQFGAGLGEVFLPWRGRVGDSVLVTVPEGARFCLDSVDVGYVGVGDLAPAPADR